jgi:hypothetical protein
VLTFNENSQVASVVYIYGYDLGADETEYVFVIGTWRAVTDAIEVDVIIDGVKEIIKVKDRTELTKIRALTLYSKLTINSNLTIAGAPDTDRVTVNDPFINELASQTSMRLVNDGGTLTRWEAGTPNVETPIGNIANTTPVYRITVANDEFANRFLWTALGGTDTVPQGATIDVSTSVGTLGRGQRIESREEANSYVAKMGTGANVENVTSLYAIIGRNILDDTVPMPTP